MTLAVAVSLLFATATAFATDFTFTGNTDNTWDKAGNWSPGGGPPDDDDTAIIPTGETCLVIDDNQEAKIINVQSGGTLKIVGQTLTLGHCNNDTTSTVNGYLLFEESGGGDPPLLYIESSKSGYLTVDGSGTISARDSDDCDPGTIAGSA